MNLGLPYKGSKNTIAEDIVKCLLQNFCKKVGKKAEKWRFMQKILTKLYKMYDFLNFFCDVSKK